MYKALYRKYRPMTFDDVCGQDHIVAILKNQISTGKIPHAYLFCGTRGTGKTSCAKILARAVNCENPRDGSPCTECRACVAAESGLNTDIVEMDAASNNGVNDVRGLIDEIAYTPTELKKRVYIIDEVHMMSQSAFNALLKTLEEPPEHVVFILATTELHKLPATIISRCQRFDFNRIKNSVICDRLRFVADEEGIDIDDEALFAMAKLSGGAMRDALGYLELCIGHAGRITAADASDLLGVTPYDTLLDIAEAVSSRRVDAILSAVERIVAKTNDISVFWADLSGVYRDMLIVKSARSFGEYIDVTPAQSELLVKAAMRMSRERLFYHMKLISDAMFLMQRNTMQKRAVAELTLIKMCDEKLDTSYESLLSRISALEDRITLGSLSVKAADTPAPEKLPEAEITKKPEAATEAAEPKEQRREPEAKKTLRTLKKWSEIVTKIIKADVSAAMFISDSAAYEGDGELYIFFSDTFAQATAEKKRPLIAECVAIVTSGKYSDDMIVFKSKESGADGEYTLIDEFSADNADIITDTGGV